MNDSPIFLLGLHKSGTSLLRSIFDGHSQIFSIPIEAHFFQNMKYWVDNEYRKQYPVKLNKNQIKEEFRNWIKFYNQLINPLADSVVKGIFNEQNFYKKISDIQEDFNDKTIMEKYYESIYFSIYNKPLNSELRIVEKSVENAEFAFELSTMFPKTKFIHILRNPYANIVSLRKFKSPIKSYPFINRLLKTMYNSFYYLYKNKNILKNYYVLRYEDLVSDPEKYINEICKFAMLDFEEILLKPTLLKKPWRGNSTFGNIYNSISSSNIDKWNKNIFPLEIYYINKYFSFILEDYQYKKIPLKGSFWKPVKYEGFKQYFANRVYKFYT
jgi:hypothetical protein